MAIHESRVLRPDENGVLREVERISAKDNQISYWDPNYGDKMMAKKSTRKQIVEGMMQEWFCEECGDTFEATAERKYCHNPCTDPNDTNTRPDPGLGLKPCKMCKEDFKPRTRLQVYCQDPCTHAEMIRNVYDPKPCKGCKELFTPHHHQQKFCYNPCTHKNTRPSSTKLKLLFCIVCKDPFFTYTKKRFCDNPCNRTIAYRARKAANANS